MSHPLISVIVPVYNAGRYIENTLHNIIVDQFANLMPQQWELIVVNDGSTDDSASIIEHCTRSCPSVKIIEKANSGAADSRNVGLDAATGEYVYFFDSDDLMPLNALESVVNIATQFRPDLIKFDLKHISTGEYFQIINNLPAIDVNDSDVERLTVADYLDATEAMTNPAGDCTWLTVYRRSFLFENSLRFNSEIIIGEDVDLTWRAVFCAHDVVYIRRELYYYHLNDKSLSNIKNLRKRQREYMALLLNMLKIRSTYHNRLDIISPGAERGLNNTIRYLSNLVLSLQVLCGESYAKIFRTMRELKTQGVDIHPGRPRFDSSLKDYATIKSNIRRWLVAYVLVIPIWLHK